VISILLVIPCSLFFIYRFFITVILRELFRRSLVEPIANQDYGFSTDDFWDNPRGGIAFAHILQGPLNVDFVYKRIADVLLGKREMLSGSEPNYDRLTSVFPCVWLGFPFWKKVKEFEFDIKKHIRLFAHAQEDEGILNVNRPLAEWLQSSFARNQPLWDILLIPGNLKTISGSIVF